MSVTLINPRRGYSGSDPFSLPLFVVNIIRLKKSHRNYFYISLYTRYGREDEEVMGLKFCNEAIIALKQIWPTTKEKEELSSLQVRYHNLFYSNELYTALFLSFN